MSKLFTACLKAVDDRLIIAIGLTLLRRIWVHDRIRLCLLTSHIANISACSAWRQKTANQRSRLMRQPSRCVLCMRARLHACGLYSEMNQAGSMWPCLTFLTGWRHWFIVVIHSLFFNLHCHCIRQMASLNLCSGHTSRHSRKDPVKNQSPKVKTFSLLGYVKVKILLTPGASIPKTLEQDPPAAGHSPPLLSPPYPVVELRGSRRGLAPLKDRVAHSKHLVWEGTSWPLKGPLKSPVKFNTCNCNISISFYKKHRWRCTVPGYMIDKPCSIFTRASIASRG